MKVPRNLTGTFPLAAYEGRLRTDIPRKWAATGEFRAPKQGEYYLSGSVVEAYKAVGSLTQPYWIARPA